MAGALAEIFSAKKTVDSPLLNRLGAQVLRTVVARAIYKSMPALSAGSEEPLRVLQRDGVLVWPNFLTSDNFQEVESEWLRLKRIRGSLPSLKFGPNHNGRIFVKDIDYELVPTIYALLNDGRLRALLEAAERRSLGELLQIAQLECLTQGASELVTDPQTQLHSDIFFSCHKAWFYITDVTLKDSPFAFVKGSHRLSLQKLNYIYKDSCGRSKEDDPSRRISLDEVARTESQSIITCPRNTLVVANTCGYHRRIQGEVGNERWSIHIDLRADPFKLRRLR
jgi:hypothetical protein